MRFDVDPLMMQYQAVNCEPHRKSLDALATDLLCFYKRETGQCPKHVLFLVNGDSVAGFFVPVPARYARAFKVVQAEMQKVSSVVQYKAVEHDVFFAGLTSNAVLQLRLGQDYSDDGRLRESFDEHVFVGRDFERESSMDCCPSDDGLEEIKESGSLNDPMFGIDEHYLSSHTPSMMQEEAALSPIRIDLPPRFDDIDEFSPTQLLSPYD
uniref:Uncharacterized protein n=1 Tax=Cygnus columbianus CRESS-DNA-virus sp. TaxID=2815027 RepID=A0A8A4XCI7_9VIRU|nr:MAG: hypothetical protein [Cygnus columbianus CRESS-DNA-virus sp.]